MKVPCFGYDVDYMAGPMIGNMKILLGDYVVRKKLYIYDWTGEKLGKAAKELDYFISNAQRLFVNYGNW